MRGSKWRKQDQRKFRRKIFPLKHKCFRETGSLIVNDARNMNHMVGWTVASLQLPTWHVVCFDAISAKQMNFVAHRLQQIFTLMSPSMNTHFESCRATQQNHHIFTANNSEMSRINVSLSYLVLTTENDIAPRPTLSTHHRSIGSTLSEMICFLHKTERLFLKKLKFQAPEMFAGPGSRLSLSGINAQTQNKKENNQKARTED